MKPYKTKSIEKEFETTGKYGSGYIGKYASGERIVTIGWKNGGETTVNSLEVNLSKYNPKSLSHALNLACHQSKMLELFQKIIIKGPKAVINLFYDPKNEKQGYATIAKKGTGQLRFSLERVDLLKMNEKTVLSAMQKIAFVSGKVSLIPVSNTPA